MQKRLGEIGFTYFAEKTNIIEQLADQQKDPLGVAMAVELAFYDFSEYLKEGMPESLYKTIMVTTELNKPLLFQALLKDYPGALEALKARGLY